MTARMTIAAIGVLACLGCRKEEVVCHGQQCLPCGVEGCPSAAEVIHRSVGYGNGTTPLAWGDGNPMRILGSVAFFDQPLPDRIGVGDALVSTFDEVTSIAFVTRRRSSTAYELQTGEGGPPPDGVGSTTQWSIFRAYASLVDAAQRNPNPAIPVRFRGFDQGAVDRKDLVATRRIWSIACYADAVDESPDALDADARFEYWTTSPQYYLRIYAPSSASEVGASQRHRGVLDPGRYMLRKTEDRDNAWAAVLLVTAQYARVEGLQLVDTAANSNDTILAVHYTGQGEVRLGGNLLFGDPDNAKPLMGVVQYGHEVTLPFALFLYDSVIAGMRDAGFTQNFEGATATSQARLYNNTFHGCGWGIYGTGQGRLVAVNNLFGAMRSGCVRNPAALDGVSDHNLCSTSEEMTGVHSASDVNARWVDPSAGDLHLALDDTAAIGKGADLSSDDWFPFSVDFEEEARSGQWDVGADQRRP